MGINKKKGVQSAALVACFLFGGAASATMEQRPVQVDTSDMKVGAGQDVTQLLV